MLNSTPASKVEANTRSHVNTEAQPHEDENKPLSEHSDTGNSFQSNQVKVMSIPIVDEET